MKFNRYTYAYGKRMLGVSDDSGIDSVESLILSKESEVVIHSKLHLELMRLIDYTHGELLPEKEQLYNLAISKLSNKKISNAQKATVRQLVDSGVICDNRKDATKRPATPCEVKIEKPADNQTGLFWLVLFAAAFLGTLAIQIVTLY